MMLTWKIFVIIISMVYLTFQTDPSGAGSSSGSPQLWVFPKIGRYYPYSVNDHNPLEKDSEAYKCLAKIRPYCRTPNDIVKSEDCAKQGIFLYRKIENDPLEWVDHFFYEFPLEPGNFDLPEKFCRGKDPKCKKDLKKYSDLLLKPIPFDKYNRTFAIGTDDFLAHKEIAGHAFRYRDLFILQEEIIINNLKEDLEETLEENFEKQYLDHISGYVSSYSSDFNPINYCKQFPPYNLRICYEY